MKILAHSRLEASRTLISIGAWLPKGAFAPQPLPSPNLPSAALEQHQQRCTCASHEMADISEAHAINGDSLGTQHGSLTMPLSYLISDSTVAKFPLRNTLRTTPHHPYRICKRLGDHLDPHHANVGTNHPAVVPSETTCCARTGRGTWRGPLKVEQVPDLSFSIYCPRHAPSPKSQCNLIFQIKSLSLLGFLLFLHLFSHRMF